MASIQKFEREVGQDRGRGHLLPWDGSPFPDHALNASRINVTEGHLAKVEIYTKMTCGFCMRAKRLLEMKKVAFEEYPVDLSGEKRAEMIERAGGRRTVPQIFINGSHVGGCDELMALEYQGRLDEMLAA